jgi:hypothetical protein
MVSRSALAVASPVQRVDLTVLVPIGVVAQKNADNVDDYRQNGVF